MAMKRFLALLIVFWWLISQPLIFAQTDQNQVQIGTSNPLGIYGFQNGDLIYYNNGVFNRLPIGMPGYVLTSVGGIPQYSAAGSGSGTVMSFSATGLSPIFTVNVATPTTTPALSFTASNALAYGILGNATASSATPTYTAPQITAGTGLSGGGYVLNNPTISLSGSLTVNAGTGLTGGGALTGSPTISLSTPVAISNGGTGAATVGADTIFSNNTAGTAAPAFNSLSLTAGTGLSGGGNLATSPTISLATPVSIANGGTGAATAAANSIFSNTSGSTAAPAFNALSITAGAGLSGGGNLTTSPTVSLSTPISVANGGTGASSVAALTKFGGSPTPGAANQAPVFNNYDRTSVMGGWSNLRALPTSGAISGDYYNSGNWTQTGAITATSVRIYNAGTLTFNNNFTVATECGGGAGGQSAGSISAFGGKGGGLGGGLGGINIAGSVATAGAGGSFGGAGGGGNSSASTGGLAGSAGTYPISLSMSGSGGGGGSGGNSGQAGGNGGAGGGSLYIESTGTITFASGTAITLNGGSGTVGTASVCGGGGSGGGLDLRCTSTVTIASGASISANGGAGGSGGIGGGGGGGGVIQIFGSTVTNTAGLTAAANCAGGAVGTGGGGSFGSAGTAGLLTLNPFVQGPRSVGQLYEFKPKNARKVA